MWPAELPHAQPGQGRASLSPSPSPLPTLLVLFLDTSWSKEKKNEQLIRRKEVANTWLSKMLFPSPGWFFPLSEQAWAPQCAPIASAFCHSGVSLPNCVLGQDGTSSVCPTSSRKNVFIDTETYCFPSLFSLSVPPQRTSEHMRSNLFQRCARGQPCSPFCFTSPRFRPMLSPFDVPAANAIFWALVPCGTSCCRWSGTWQRGWTTPGGSLNVIVGNGEANIVVVTSHFVVGRAANRNDAFHSQLVHREVIGVNDPSVPVQNTTRAQHFTLIIYFNGGH